MVSVESLDVDCESAWEVEWVMVNVNVFHLKPWAGVVVWSCSGKTSHGSNPESEAHFVGSRVEWMSTPHV